MGRLIVTCECGKNMKVPEGGLGKVGRCPECGKKIKITDENTRTTSTKFSDDSHNQPEQNTNDSSPPSLIPSKSRKRFPEWIVVAVLLLIGIAGIAALRARHTNQINSSTAIVEEDKTPPLEEPDPAITPSSFDEQPQVAPESAVKSLPSLESPFDKILELKDDQTPKEQIETYIQLVRALPQDAIHWIADMGQFIEDRKVSQEERQLLEYLTRALDPLIVLTSPRIMDGVSAADVEWAKSFSSKKGGYLYLDKDLEEIERLGLFKSGVRPALKNLVTKAGHDFEVRKGLNLIFNFGHPPQEISRCRYNTQLLMLCNLLHYGIPDGEETLALAAALDYGSVLSISEQSLWPRIVEFVRHRLNLISETSVLVKGQGADWDPYEYPLEACIGLIWGTRSQGAKCRLASRFHESPLEHEEFKPLFARANTMVEIRDWLIDEGIFSEEVNLERYVRENPVLGTNYDLKVSVAAELAIRRSWQLDIWHPDFRRFDVNWQWEYYKDCGSFSGGCETSGAMGSFMMRSLNVAALEQPHGYWHYVPSDDVWRFDAHEMIRHFRETADHGFLWTPDPTTYYKIPWENHRFGESDEIDKNRICFYETKHANCVPDGVPSGYVFRKTLPQWWEENY